VTDDDVLPVVRAAHLADTAAQEQWLVRSLWGRAAVGILGGAPKCCKSWLALELAVSVASGKPCLGRFAVEDPGAVMLYMAEDSAAVVKARLQGLCWHRSFGLDGLPIDVITAPSVRIDRACDQDRLTRTVRRAAPRLLVLDPFVRLHRIDENDAGQVSAVLGYLRALQRDLDLAVLIVHHARKNGSGGQAGQNLRGSGDLHAWGDSNLYLRRQQGALSLSIEHRAAAAPDPFALRLVPTPDGEAYLDLVVPGEVPDRGTSELELLIVSTLAAAGEPLGRTALRDKVRVRNERLGDVLTRLVAAGRIVRTHDRWAVPVPSPTP
jgi:hypothetical protein